MKKLIPYILIAFFLSACQDLAVDKQQLTQNSRDAVKALGGELKQTLQASMKAKGPIDSVAVCQIEAPKIADSISKAKGLSVARTALKYRNANNKPDDWERSVLEQFEQRKQEGEPVKTLEFSAVAEHNGNKVFRYMKAIPTGEVCLTCHGGSVAPAIAEKINRLYPDDKATGFKVGDIRGAFTVTQEIK